MKQFLKVILIAVLISLLAAPSWAFTITISNSYKTDRESVRIGTITFDGTYPTGGEALTAANLNLASLRHITLQPVGGQLFEYDYTNAKVIGYNASGSPALGNASVTHTHTSPTSGATSGGTPAGSNGTSAVTLGSGASAAGASHNHVFTGTSAGSLDLAAPAFLGTGLTVAGQVFTTTSTHTMTLNECAGMWLLPATATTPPMLIVSNTAVTGAAAVLTVIGAAATDAGAYKIVKNIVPVGTNAAEVTHTHASGTLAGTAAAQTFTGNALATHTHTGGATGNESATHIHTATAEAATEVGAGDVNGVIVKFYAVGY